MVQCAMSTGIGSSSNQAPEVPAAPLRKRETGTLARAQCPTVQAAVSRKASL